MEIKCEDSFVGNTLAQGQIWEGRDWEVIPETNTSTLEIHYSIEST